MAKDKFKSKSGFILASVGAAVGLGNAVRFPGLCAKYGGGAFLFVYFVALAVLGVPLLCAELSLGRKFGGGAPLCLERLKKGGGAVGWASSVNSVLTAVIYAGLAGWIIAMAVNIVPLSFSGLSRSEISFYFFDEVLSARTDGVISGFSPLVLAGIFGAWLFMFACMKGGAGALASFARFTVIIPVVLLLLMAGRGLLYESSASALQALFLPDFSKLKSFDIWLNALGQVFFSLSVAVGIMPAYGAYLPDRTHIFGCGVIIACADFLVSALSSVVLFTTLYGNGMSAAIESSGLICAFSLYPVAITRLFGANGVLNAITGVAFYISLAMMAVQSGVSMAEAFVSPFISCFNLSRKKVAAILCALGFLASSVFSTTAAVTVADISDRFINFYSVLFLGTAECLIIGSSKKQKTLADEVNAYSKRIKLPPKLFSLSVKFLSPAVLGTTAVCEVFRLFALGINCPAHILLIFGVGAEIAVLSSAIALEYRLSKKTRTLQRLTKTV